MTRWLPSLALVLAATIASPRAAWADDDEKKKPTTDAEVAALDARYPPFSTRFAVLSAGLLVTGAAWGVSYGAARGWPEVQCRETVAGPVDAYGHFCSSGPPGANQLGIPVVGPWITLGKSGCASDDPNCATAKVVARGIAFLIDGIVQAAGAALFIQGLVMKTEPAKVGETKSAFAFHINGIELKPAPMVSPSLQGVGVTGVF